MVYINKTQKNIVLAFMKLKSHANVFELILSWNYVHDCVHRMYIYIILPFIPNFGVVFHISLHKILNLKI
jgi:hypothetical protein